MRQDTVSAKGAGYDEALITTTGSKHDQPYRPSGIDGQRHRAGGSVLQPRLQDGAHHLRGRALWAAPEFYHLQERYKFAQNSSQILILW